MHPRPGGRMRPPAGRCMHRPGTAKSAPHRREQRDQPSEQTRYHASRSPIRRATISSATIAMNQATIPSGIGPML